MGEPKKSDNVPEMLVISEESMKTGGTTGPVILSNNIIDIPPNTPQPKNNQENTITFHDTFGETGGNMPSVTKLLQRKKIDGSPSAPVVAVAKGIEQKTTTLSRMRSPGSPPEFKLQLILNPCNYKTLKERISKYKKSIDLKKLSFLEYFKNYFTEIAFYEQGGGTLKGVLGYGNPRLVVNTKGVKIAAQGFQTLFEILTSQNIFIGSSASLRPEDVGSFNTIGFSATDCIGVFPVILKGSLLGVWLCTGSLAVNIDAKEQKNLLKTLAEL